MGKIDLIQPRHMYSPPVEVEPHGHIYFPTSLLAAGARIMQAGGEVHFHDHNIRNSLVQSENIGYTLLGAPYIPEVIRLMHDVRKQVGGNLKFFFGGQVIPGLSPSQFERLFGMDSVNGNNDFALVHGLNIDMHDLPSSEETSLIPSYEKISDEDMKLYLSREISFYTSQGCKFACDFCAAVRTFKDPITRQVNRVKESYRQTEIMEKDLNYLIERALQLGLEKLSLYLSNLDVFQTPEKLMEFAQIVQRLLKMYPKIKLEMRGLATVDSFLHVFQHSPKVIEAMVEAGFNRVGFGVDGMTPQVWKGVGKAHNTLPKCVEAIRVAKEIFGMTPETLMVIGHPEVDTEETLEAAYQFTKDMLEQYGAEPRPYVARNFIPGNSGWVDMKNASSIEQLMKHPELFQALDFTALPSRLTHPDAEIRRLTSATYRKLCALPNCGRQIIRPIEPDMTEEEIAEVKRFNLGSADT